MPRFSRFTRSQHILFNASISVHVVQTGSQGQMRPDTNRPGGETNFERQVDELVMHTGPCIEPIPDIDRDGFELDRSYVPSNRFDHRDPN